jgi:undecaprenyl-diphosphatase
MMDYINLNDMLYAKMFLLSLIQGLTEFLPISSTAHLIVLKHFLKLNGHFVVYQIVIQLASALAIFIFFRKKIIGSIFSLHNNKNSRDFAYKIILAFIPCAVVGFLFYKYIKVHFYTNLVIAIALIMGGIVFLIIDKIKLNAKYSSIDKMTKSVAFSIGVYQILAIIPGVSRSGSTIVGGLLSNLSRKAAVEFSFLLAIPTILIASIYDLYKNYDLLKYVDMKLLTFASVTSFLVSMFVLKGFLGYISNHNFDIFGYYRIILGLTIIMMSL